jgi:hypothetical protein
MFSNKRLVVDKKKAIVVSPQSWGNMFISKHHYAVELVKLGYEVFFVNPPQERKLVGLPCVMKIETEYKNLFVIKHSLFFSSYLKFHVPLLHHFLIFYQRWFLLRKIGEPNLILSFDLTNNFPLNGLNCKKIFFASDEPRFEQNFISARNADLIISVSGHILDLYSKHFPKTKTLLINHGLCEDFLNIPTSSSKKYKGINVGLSGNFLFGDIDYPVLTQIIDENPTIIFHFFGNISKNSNVGADTSDETLKNFDNLLSKRNCKFHGVLSKKDLALELNEMDAFLICYNPHKGQSSGSNSHKIIEFLSTGKVIISSHFSFYDKTDIFVMNERNNSNSELVKIFESVVSDLNKFNDEQKVQQRKSFAMNNLYQKNIIKILNN